MKSTDFIEKCLGKVSGKGAYGNNRSFLRIFVSCNI